MSEFIGIRRGDTIVAAGEADLEQIRKYRQDEPIKLNGTQGRSVKQNARFRALMQIAWINWPERAGHFPSAAALVEALKGEIGFWEPRKTLTGKVYYQLKSFSFKECEQGEFTGAVKQVIDLVCGVLQCTELELEMMSAAPSRETIVVCRECNTNYNNRKFENCPICGTTNQGE